MMVGKLKIGKICVSFNGKYMARRGLKVLPCQASTK